MPARAGLLALFLGLLLPCPATPQTPAAPVGVEVEAPSTILVGLPFSVRIQVPDGLVGTPFGIQTAGGAQLASGMLEAGENEIDGLVVASRADLPLAVSGPGFQSAVRPLLLPAWLSLLPPLLAIALALIFREVVISLFAGIWLGALFVTGLNPLTATTTALDDFVLGTLADPDRLAIVLFSLLLGGLVGVMARSGGTRGIVEVLRPFATSPRRGQLMTALSGLVIFFDDYANTLIVGNTMRPVTDRLRVSREKLAYIVDSTAAPVAAIAAISTWVGFEVSLIGTALEAAAGQATDPAVQASLLAGAANPFAVFIHSIPYRFYSILAIGFVFMVAISRRDFGPMLTAERRAASGGGVLRPGSVPAADPTANVAEPPEGSEHRWYNAVVPIIVVVFVALAAIVSTGRASLGPGDHAIWDIVGEGDPFRSLLWASFAGCVIGMLLPTLQRILSVGEAVQAWLGGLRSMLLAIVILVLAWGLGGVTETLGTGNFLAEVLQGTLPLRLLPVLVFLVAAGISFATGTSWGTMAILFPVVIPVAVAMGAGIDFDGGESYTVLLGAISSIMAGSIFGDHCSPISDTTVLSSMASACDHIDHVRTQLPYAALVAAVGMTVGDIPTAYGLSPWISLAVGFVILWTVLRLVGQRSDEREEFAAAGEAGT